MRNVLVLIFSVLFVLTAFAEYGPEPTKKTEEVQRMAEPDEIDLLLMRKAIHNEINARRTAGGVNTLVHNSLISKVAADHNNYLATQRKIGHEQPTPGKETLSKRFEGRTNITKDYAAAENVLRITVNNSSDGKAFYAETAKKMVDAWYNSETHKVNLMNEKYTITGISVHYNPRNKALTVTQVFARVGRG